MRYLEHSIETFSHLLLLAFSLSVASLSCYLFTITGNVKILLPFAISGFFVAASDILSYYRRYLAFILGTKIVAYVFHTATGIILLEDAVENGGYYKKNILVYYKVIIALFVLNLSLLSITFPRISTKKHKSENDLEKQKDIAFSSSETEIESPPNHMFSPPRVNFFSHIQNKPSEHTLVDKGSNNTPERIQDLKLKSSTPNIVCDRNIDKQISDWFRFYKFEDGDARGDPHHFFGSESTLPLNKTHCDTVQYHEKDIHEAKRTDNPQSIIKFKSFLPKNSIPESNRHTNDTVEVDYNVNNLEKHNKDETESNIKRAKSTSYLSSRKQCQKQRKWKSIQDERLFLNNIDDSLLPPILKRSKSSKEHNNEQELYSVTLPTLHNQENDNSCTNSPNKNTSFSWLNKTSDRHRDSTDASTLEKQDTHSLDKEGDSDEHIGISISEFDEPIDQSYFHDFDQTSTVVTVAETSEHMPQNEKHKLKHRTLGKTLLKDKKRRLSVNEIYLDALNGLESIPRSLSYLNIEKFSTEKELGNNTGYISLKEWEKEAGPWFENKNRVGLNLAIPGISKRFDNCNSLQPDRNTRKSTSESPQHGDHSITDIDEISDIDQSSVGENNDLKLRTTNTTSCSSPSLYTYRDIPSTPSNSSHRLKGSEVPTPSFEGNKTSFCNNSPATNNAESNLQPQYEQFSTPPVSPIKKFFQRSPKRLNEILKRRGLKRGSTTQSDLSASSHYHKNSTVSSILRQDCLAHPTEHRKNISDDYPMSSQNSPLKAPFSHFVPERITIPYPDQFPNVSDDSYSFGELAIQPSSDKSRVSSGHSAIIGEYDREKWRTLKYLGK